MPLIPPQPYGMIPAQAPSNEMSSDLLYSGSGEHENQYQYQYHAVKPMRIRPPAIIHIGKPVRPGKPSDLTELEFVALTKLFFSFRTSLRQANNLRQAKCEDRE